MIHHMHPPRLTIANVLVLIFVVAIALALFAWHQRAELQDRDLRLQLRRARMGMESLERMDRILTERGIDILKHCSSVELPRTSGGIHTSTGLVLEKDVAYRAACVLLDHRNFRYGHQSGDPGGPQVGLRFGDGHSTLDVLVGLDVEAHQDVWIQIHDEGGKEVHKSGPAGMSDPTLQKLVEELLSLLDRAAPATSGKSSR